MSVTMMEDIVAVTVTVKVVPCAAGGFAWALKDDDFPPIIGQADNMNDVSTVVSEGIQAYMKLVLSRYKVQSETG